MSPSERVLTKRDSSGLHYTYELQLDATLDSGTYEVLAHISDPRGNSATVTLGSFVLE